MMRLSACALLACSLLWAHDPISTKLTWSQEISRIVYRRCASCHRPGGSTPMSLRTYAEVRPWAKAIKEEVLSRRMPPWGAVKGFGDFREDPSLTQDEMTRIAEWVEGGAPEGDSIYLPPFPNSIPVIAVPAGLRTRAVRGPATLLGIRPLSSVAASQVTALLPDGSKIPLLWLQDYKREWNRTFVYRDPVVLPQGASIHVEPPIRLEFIVRK